MCIRDREGGAALLSGGYDSATLDRLGREISATRLIYLATTLQKATADLYYSSNRRTDAELCLLRLCDEMCIRDSLTIEPVDEVVHNSGRHKIKNKDSASPHFHTVLLWGCLLYTSRCE